MPNNFIQIFYEVSQNARKSTYKNSYRANRNSFENVLATVQEANLEAELDGINSSRFIFHTLHSLDKWFINPAEYKYDEKSCGGTEENLSIISSSSLLFSAAKGVVIPRKNLKIYANFVTKKIRSYMASMTDKMLFEKPDGCDFTRLKKKSCKTAGLYKR